MPRPRDTPYSTGSSDSAPALPDDTAPRCSPRRVALRGQSESALRPGAHRPLARTAQDDQLLLEQKILRDHRSHATGATQRRGHDGQVKQGEQEVLHARDSVGQTSGATQRCLNPGCSERIGNSRRTGEEQDRDADRRQPRLPTSRGPRRALDVAGHRRVPRRAPPTVPVASTIRARLMRGSRPAALRRCAFTWEEIDEAGARTATVAHAALGHDIYGSPMLYAVRVYHLPNA